MPNVLKQSAKSSTTSSPTTAAESAWDLVDTVRMLLYGKSGTGKTTFAATFPDPILWLLCSGGNKPGELRSIDTPENRKRVAPRIISSTSQLKSYIDEAEEYKTVVLDHASGLQDLTLKEILGLEELPAQKSWGMAKQGDYGQSSLMCKELFRALLNCPGNVVIVAQERNFGGEDTSSDIIQTTVSAALTPSVTGWLGPACDYVVQTFLKPKMEKVKANIGGKEHITERRGVGVEFCLRTGSHDVYQTKFRIPRGIKLPEYIVDPSYDKVMALIKGKDS